MKQILLIAKAAFSITLLASMLLVITPAQAEIPIQKMAQQNTIAPMLRKTMPAVVSLLVQGEVTPNQDPFRKHAQELQPEKKEDSHSHKTPQIDINGNKFVAAGSGVIIDADKGLIVTNAHVVDQAKSILVTLSDGRRFLAHKIGNDDAHDVALLAIKAKHLTALSFGDSSKLQIGDFVAAIGSPFNLKQTVTSGIISALHRSGIGIEGFENFIQTDAPINPGNSGGALVNMSGQLIGINTAMIAPHDGGNVGIGLAIPANTVEDVVEQLLKYGKVKRGMLGVQIQTLTPNLAISFGLPQQKGAIVTFVVPFSAGDKAGLKPGDIIIAANGDKIETAAEIKNQVGLLRIGSKVNITFIRNRKTLHRTATITNNSDSKNAMRENHPFLYGVTTRNITLSNPELGEVSGTEVTYVNYDSPAWISDLRPGDIIVSVNNQPIHNITELAHAVKENQHEELLLNVLRGNGYFFIVIH